MRSRETNRAWWWLAVSMAIGAGACAPHGGEATAPNPAEAAPRAATNAATRSAAADPTNVPFDLGQVMRQVHFAFREDRGHWRGGDASYAVDVSDSSFTVTPRMGEGTSHREGAAIRFATERAGRESAAASVRPSIRIADDGHLDIARDGSNEALRNGDDGVEQSWTFAQRPDGHGDLEVRVAVSGGNYVGETHGGLHFVDPSSTLGLRYGHATWIDANGARLAVPARWDGHSVVLRVPAATVDTAAYPCVLDPTIGPEFGTDTPVPVGNIWEQTQPSIATGAGQWFVVWEDGRSLVPGIFGARVNSAGTVLDRNGVSIATTSGSRLYAPSVAFNGTTWLVAWESDQTSPPLEKNIYGARVSTAGVVLDTTPLPIATGTYDQMLPAVSSDGSQWLVAWQDHYTGTGTGASFDIRGSLISAAGATTMTFTIGAAYADQTRPAIGYNGTEWLVAWEDQRAGNAVIYTTRVSRTGTIATSFGNPMPGSGTTQSNPSIASDGTNWLVAWDEYRGGNLDVMGARISSTGALLDVSGIVIATATGAQSDAAVAWSGTNYVVAWSDMRTDTYGDIYAARVTPAGVVLDTAGVPVCAITQLQRWPALDFNGSQALVVFADNRYANYRDVYGVRIDGALTVIDTASFAISTSANTQNGPVVSFNGTNYLLVWQDRRRDLDYDIYGVRVTRTGTVLDPSGIAISTAANRQSAPDVSADGNNWLVVWGDERVTAGTADLYGARVSAAGAVLDPTGFAISSATNNQNLPSVAYDGTNYLVVWNDGRGGSFTDIYGARVSPAGAVLDATGFVVCGAADYQSGPDVAFNGTQYFVVWMDRRSTSRYDIYGGRVTPAGAVLDGSGIALSTASGGKYSPAISSNGTQWLAVWYQDRSIGGPDVYGIRIGATGAAVGSAFAISATVDDQYFPDVTFDGSNWVVVWQDDRLGGLGDLYGARVSAAGSVVDSAGVLLASTTTYINAPAITAATGGEMLVAYERLDNAQGYVDRVFGRTLVWGGDPGASCGSGSECVSGFCVDGVCCSSACGSGATTDCMACSVAAGAATNGTCGPVAAARVCRAAATGGCDVPEMCDGTALACPADGFAPATQTCRTSAGMCDVAEMCTGSAAACPADGFAPATQTCRTSAGMCDVAETCTGSSAACPADGFAPATQTCRTSAGMCDVAETCTGSSATCPADGFAPATQTCRTSAGACDIAESCTGSSATCPTDAVQPNGTSCADSLTCNGAETCSMGACVAGAALACDDGDVCTADSCGEPAGCAHDAIAGCCHGASECNDSDACTDDACVANVCVHMPLTGCGVDAGTEDVVDVVDATPEDGGEDVVDVFEVDATDAIEDAVIDVAVDSPIDTAVDAPLDVARDTGVDVATADVADVVAPVDAGADVAITDAARDARGDVVDEGTGMPRGCACRAGQTGSSSGRGLAMLSLFAVAGATARRRRRQSARQNVAS